MRAPVPKEHGAWGMLLLPLLAGLVVGGRWDGAAGMTVVLVVSAYVARAPLDQIARGRRGEPWGWLALDLGVAAAAAGWLLLGWQRVAWLPVVGGLAGGLVLAVLLARRQRSRDLLAELAGAALLPLTALVATAVAADQLTAAGWTLWGAFALYNIITVPYVRTWVMARRAAKDPKWGPAGRQARRAAWRGLAAGSALLAALVAAGLWPPLLALAYVPGFARIVAGLPRAGVVEVPIRQLGWLELAHATAFAVVATVAVARVA